MRALYRALKRSSPFISRTYFHLTGYSFLNLSKFRIERLTPNLLIIGAQKSGTSSLHSYLNYHPDIFMSPIKEPGFYLDFSLYRDILKRDNNISAKSPKQLLKKYMLQGYAGQLYIGESSTYYTLGDRCRQHNVPVSIFRTNNKTKFVYILRNPFSRIVSAYLHERRKGRAQVDIDEFTMNRENTNPDHVCLKTSLYYNQLSEYLKLFDKSQFKIFLFEDFIQSPEKCLNDIFSFLSIRLLNQFPPFKIHHKSKNRSNYTDHELKFSEPVYSFLLKQFENQKTNLESLMGIPIANWDFSRCRWCKS